MGAAPCGGMAPKNGATTMNKSVWAERLAIDTFGVPEFFTTHLHLEAAGNGLIRSIRLIERGGIMIPVFSYVTPASSMIINGPMHKEFAQETLRLERVALGAH